MSSGKSHQLVFDRDAIMRENPFPHWRYEKGVSFGKGVTNIPLTLLRNGTVTAAYLDRRHYEWPGKAPAGDTPETILAGYSWLEPEDIQACLIYAHKLVSHERVEPLVTSSS